MNTQSTFIEEATVAGKDYRVIWHGKEFVPPRELTLQSGGICFTISGDIVLVAGPENRNWSLPGGHLERAETIEQAFIREVREEACAEVLRCAYIGCQEVHEFDRGDEPGLHFSARFWARVELLPFRPEFEIVRRTCVPPNEFIAALNWSTVRCARAILDAGLREERKRCPLKSKK